MSVGAAVDLEQRGRARIGVDADGVVLGEVGVERASRQRSAPKPLSRPSRRVPRVAVALERGGQHAAEQRACAP